MVGYHEWLAEQRERAFANFEAQRGFRPAWPPIDTIKAGKDDGPLYRAEYKPFDRIRIVTTTLWECEKTFACYTQLLADPFGGHNHEHFLDWMAYANDRYARALKLKDRIRAPEPVEPAKPQLDLFGTPVPPSRY